MKELIKLIMEREGKKNQASIGDVREILKILAYIMANDQEMFMVFRNYVAARKMKVKNVK